MRALARCLWCWLVGLVLLAAGTAASAAVPLPSCSGCNPYEDEQCVLTYGAAGVVQDAATGEPLAGATITVLDLQTVSAADGSYRVEGTRPDTCTLDYFYSITVAATGYVPFSIMYWASSTFSNLTVALAVEGDGGEPTPTVCPVATPCILGERPHPCADAPCGLGCGCEPCPPCGDGEIRGPRIHACECMPEPGATPPTPTATPFVVPTPTLAPCAGDCDGNGAITVAEIVSAVRQALGGPTACASADRDRNGVVAIAELVAMVAAALHGCAA